MPPESQDKLLRSDPAPGPGTREATAAPARAFLVVVLSILMGEALSIWFGDRFVPDLGLLHEVMDGTGITILALPCLYFFFFRPLRRALREKAMAEDSLRAVCRDLDATVRTRTLMLEELNRTLERSRAQYSSLVENSPTGIFILRNDRITFGNHRFFDMLGRPKEERPDLDPEPFIHPDDRDAVKALWRRRIDGDLARGDCDFRIIPRDGEVRWLRGRTSLLLLAEGPALLGNVQDITERYQAERRVKESREALRQLSARLLTVQEEERKRVAQELHDGIGQSLTAVKFMVERAIRGAREQPGQSHFLEVLDGVVPVIKDTVEETRRICMALRPSVLDDLGLVATLEWFAREFRKAYPHLRVELEVEVQERQVPDVLKTGIFRITQEAANNAAKYARADRVEIGLRWLRDELILTVRDDGVGFDPQARRDPSRSGGFGLASMRERAELEDGVLLIDSAPGRGTAITAKWPLIEAQGFVELFYDRAGL